MYFRYPPGIEAISVQQQNFGIDHTELVELEDGKKVRYNYFRAPEHFAGTIMSLNMGFHAVPKPEGAPDDLVAGEPGQIAVVDHLTAQMSELQTKLDEEQRLRKSAETDREALAEELFEVQCKLAEVTGKPKPERPTMPEVQGQHAGDAAQVSGGQKVFGSSTGPAAEVAGTVREAQGGRR